MPTWLIILFGILIQIALFVIFLRQEDDGNNIAKQYVESQSEINNNEMSYKVTYDKRLKTISHITVIKTKHLSPAFENTLYAQYSQNNSRENIVIFKYYTDKEIIKSLAKANIKLRFYTTTDDGYVLEDATYAPDDYESPITKAEMMKHVESRLEKQAASLCVRLPIKIDDGFDMTNVAYHNTTKLFTYFITVDDIILFNAKLSDLSEYCSIIMDFAISEFQKTILSGDNMEIAVDEILDIYEEIGVSMRIAMVDNRGNIICFKDRRLTKNLLYYE